MKTIGLLGGMSWQSTVDYYRCINQEINLALGGFHSGQIILYSVDFDPIEKLQRGGDWDSAAKILVEAALTLQTSGADFVLLCTNTMHRVAPQIESAMTIPLLHIADATADVLVTQGFKKIGLLGTQFTMEQDFYKARLSEHFDLSVLVPEQSDRAVIHNIIFNELCFGKIKTESKIELLGIIDQLVNRGAEAIILGCTELGLLINQDDTPIKLFDTTAIHAKKAVEMALNSNS